MEISDVKLSFSFLLSFPRLTDLIATRVRTLFAFCNCQPSALYGFLSASPTVCIALYTVAKLPRPISSILVKLPIADESFDDLLEVVDVDPGAAMMGDGSPILCPVSRRVLMTFRYRLNCGYIVPVRSFNMGVLDKSGTQKASDEECVDNDVVEWALLQRGWRDRGLCVDKASANRLLPRERLSPQRAR